MGTIFYKIKTKNDGWIYGYASRLPQGSIEITEKQYLSHIADERLAGDIWAQEYESLQAPIIESAKNKLLAVGLTEEELKLIIK